MTMLGFPPRLTLSAVGPTGLVSPSLFSLVRSMCCKRNGPVAARGLIHWAHGEKDRIMAGFWTSWKRFPDSQRGELMQAPVGPGVYEVRRISNGEVVAFGPSASVARDLAAFRPAASRLPWARPFEREEAAARASEFEYRTCSALSKHEAKEMARHLQGRREIYLKRRFAWA
jgi:hypothetical protein